MKQASKLLSANGATALNWFIHTPVCCPSRAELLSGRYFHNVVSKTGKGCMHVDTTNVRPSLSPIKFLALVPHVDMACQHSVPQSQHRRPSVCAIFIKILKKLPKTDAGSFASMYHTGQPRLLGHVLAEGKGVPRRTTRLTPHTPHIVNVSLLPQFSSVANLDCLATRTSLKKTHMPCCSVLLCCAFDWVV